MEQIHGSLYIRLDQEPGSCVSLSPQQTADPPTLQINGQSLITYDVEHEQYELTLGEVQPGDHVYLCAGTGDSMVALFGIVRYASVLQGLTFIHFKGVFYGQHPQMYWGILPCVGGFGVDDADTARVYSSLYDQELPYRDFLASWELLRTLNQVTGETEDPTGDFAWALGVLNEWRDRRQPPSSRVEEP